MKYLFSLALTCAIAAAAWGQSYPQTQDQGNTQQNYPQQNQTYPQQPSQTYPDQNQGYPQQNQTYPQQNQTYPQQTPAGSTAQNLTIPAGTDVQIRTNEAINANADSAGRSYSAEIARDVIGDNGAVVIPRGSNAQLSVGKISAGNMGTGSNEVALTLQSVTVNGRTYQVATNPVQQTSNDQRGIGANKRTATMTGGGALLGTVIGAVAGGGKGALIGAVVGGGAGAAAQVATRGKEVKVPAETLLTFKLDQPVTLQ